MDERRHGADGASPGRGGKDPLPRGSAAPAAAVWPGPGPAESLEVVVRAAGRLPIPRLVVRLLDLVRGDMMLLDVEPEGLVLEPYREVVRRSGDLSESDLERLTDDLPPERFGMVASDVTLFIPRNDFPLVPGETLVWQVEDRSGSFRLSVRRKTGHTIPLDFEVSR